jgi:hypothetical protein
VSAYAEAMALARSEALRDAAAFLRAEAARMRAACAGLAPSTSSRGENLAAAVALCRAADAVGGDAMGKAARR